MRTAGSLPNHIATSHNLPRPPRSIPQASPKPPPTSPSLPASPTHGVYNRHPKRHSRHKLQPAQSATDPFLKLRIGTDAYRGTETQRAASFVNSSHIGNPFFSDSPKKLLVAPNQIRPVLLATDILRNRYCEEHQSPEQAKPRSEPSSERATPKSEQSSELGNALKRANEIGATQAQSSQDNADRWRGPISLELRVVW